ncbi:NAD-dependent epimerase/dehydratase family protein [Chloroflexota bacterium]
MTSGFNLDGALRDRQVLVTGGTGFVGGRLVERLILEQGAMVRVLVRSYGSAARVARLPIELVQGDITDADAVQRAVDGCEIVFHCAHGNSGSPEERRLINLGGTENVMQAALRAGMQRVVHLSTLRVYGDTDDGELDESAPYRYSGNLYSDTKLDAESVVQSLIREHGLPATILQPTHIYGPRGPRFSVRVLERLKTDRLILVNGGTGLCNVVYIDDVVDAILLGATVKSAVGETFLISDGAPTTWIEYYRGYRDMLGRGEMISFSAEELLTAYQAWRHSRPNSVFREILNLTKEDRQIRRRLFATPEVQFAARVGKLILPKGVRRSLVGSPAPPSLRKTPGVKHDIKSATVPIVDPTETRSYASHTRVRIDKAKRVLGYRPRFDLESGLERTAQWAEWANLL